MTFDYSLADCEKALRMHEKCLAQAQRDRLPEPIIATLDCQVKLLREGIARVWT